MRFQILLAGLTAETILMLYLSVLTDASMSAVPRRSISLSNLTTVSVLIHPPSFDISWCSIRSPSSLILSSASIVFSIVFSLLSDNVVHGVHARHQRPHGREECLVLVYPLLQFPHPVLHRVEVPGREEPLVELVPFRVGYPCLELLVVLELLPLLFLRLVVVHIVWFCLFLLFYFLPQVSGHAELGLVSLLGEQDSLANHPEEGVGLLVVLPE